MDGDRPVSPDPPRDGGLTTRLTLEPAIAADKGRRL
jgi:hypothetical protein